MSQAEPSTPKFLEVAGESPRDRLVAALRLDLLGPGDPDELIDQSPNSRYLVGMLAPRGTPIDPVEDESADAAAVGDEDSDSGARMSAALDASSIGISFVVADGAEDVKVTATWGEYQPITSEEQPQTEPDTEEPSDAEAGGDGSRRRRPLRRWQRSPCSAEVEMHPLSEGSRREPVADGVVVAWTVRRLAEAWFVSLFLVNERDAPIDRRPPDELWLYQPRLGVVAEGAPFLARSFERTEPDDDPDIASADLIYRRRLEFATGHGVSAAWRKADGEEARAEEVWTEVVPDRAVPAIVPRGADDVPNVSLDALAEADAAGARALVEPLLSSYEEWIDKRATEAGSLGPAHAPVANDHIFLAREALRRMRDGLAVLEENPDALAAFRFANQAVAEAMRRSADVRRKRRGEAEAPVQPEWRPFQLAFVLLCLRGIADPRSEDRELVDLLWFPTGGGKTEAYLALTAFVLGFRRLRRHEDDLDSEHGTAVLMRYTLRLLTIQQFQRALTLICACEALRAREPERWGRSSFTIGLWVGMSATPNLFEQSKEALEVLRRGEPVFHSSPYQILWCPWCGDDLAPGDYVADDELTRTKVVCRNTSCDYSGAKSEFGLPVFVVDEEIYRHPPSLVIATVDKFAQMPWNGRIQALFGRVDRFCPRHGFLTAGEVHPASHRETPANEAASVVQVERHLAPPDLIIQDELHLISGPLGTLVGLYETAVDGLCSRPGEPPTGPKIVSSTATIRRASEQVRALFAKDVSVFPPLGIDAADSFFARQAKATEEPGRLYVGVYAPGKSVKTALVRVYGALLSRAQIEFEGAGESDKKLADSYMTLVGYFNSLRELGGALRLVEDDVPSRLRVLRRRGFGPQRTLYEHKELTSRVASSRIPEILKQLERTHLDRKPGEYPLDLLLASNMISVGVDIDRLGLMVVSGQPKTAAEYIQATSRVGRVHPGLVVEVFNWIRPRDTSHYERFAHFHDTFYRHVEATSVTPFSARARDRALRAVLVAYARLYGPKLVGPRDADDFDRGDAFVQTIVDDIVARAIAVTQDDAVGVETRALLDDSIERWGRWAGDEQELVYTERSARTSPPPRVLLRSMEGGQGLGAWEASGSLREVEEEIDVVVFDRGEL